MQHVVQALHGRRFLKDRKPVDVLNQKVEFAELSCDCIIPKMPTECSFWPQSKHDSGIPAQYNFYGSGALRVDRSTVLFHMSFIRPVFT